MLWHFYYIERKRRRDKENYYDDDSDLDLEQFEGMQLVVIERNMHFIMYIILDPSENTSEKTKKPKPTRQRATKLSAIEMLEKKFKAKSEVKKMELDLKRKELKEKQMERDFEQAKRMEEERDKRLSLEFAERRAMLELVQSLAPKSSK